jgi:hypothetical protein
LFVIAMAACGQDIPPRELHYDLGVCGTVDIVPEDLGRHFTPAAMLTWSTEPPTSGDHFQMWAAWNRSYQTLARGFWVHNLEHGAIVLLYRCDAGCPAEVAALEAAVRAMPTDADCEGNLRVRSLVANDPLLPIDRTFAAVAWGAMYVASCVDEPAILEFTRDFYARAPEDFCTEGASLGGIRIDPP